MKKSFLLLIIHLGFLFPLAAQINFSIEPIISSSLGKYDEYVLSFSGKGMVSKLEWQELPLFKIGTAAELSINSFLINADFFYGLPFNCGKMFDSDWNDHGIKTTYSISNNYAKRNYSFSLSAGYKFELVKITLVPQISFEYVYDFFQTNEGHGWYGSEKYSKTGVDVSWDSPDARYYKKLSRISLSRKNWYFFSGINIFIPMSDKLLVHAGSFIAPFAYTYNSDYHYDDNGKNQDFYLNSSQNMLFSRFKESLGFRYKINQKISASFTTNIIFGDIQKGILEGWEQYAGTDVFLADMRFGIKINF